MIKLSKTKKLDGISSWSTPAGTTCPGAKHAEVCKGCYAKGGNYRFQNVKEPREHNSQIWKHEDFIFEFIKELDNHRYFRWFDSGDIVSVSQALKILSICQLTPWVKHWIPTRSYKIPAIKAILEELNKLPNVVVRYSSDSYNEDTTPEDTRNKSMVITNECYNTDFLCMATTTKGTCSGCRACWDKSIHCISYMIHGKVALAHAKKLSRL